MITVYGLTYCPYSKETQKLLKKKNLKYKMVWVTDETKQQYQKKHGMQTFPQIFLDKEKIGGLNELENLIDISEETIELEINPILISKIVKELKH